MADDVKIVMFCCNWCSYGGADTAGTARMQYPPNIRVIRVMCSGRIDPQFILKAFKEGADKYEAQLKDLFNLLIKQGYIASDENG